MNVYHRCFDPWLSAAALLSFGCVEPSSGLSERSLCIYQGSSEESYLHMPSDMQSAVRHLEVHIEGHSEPAHCTATHVAPDWLLTARHCVSAGETVVIGSECDSTASLTILETALHPVLDLALIRLGAPSQSRASIRVSEWTPAEGDHVQLAGYGLTHLGTIASLNFAVESVSQVEESTFQVTGNGDSGACAGDSGGPALVRGSRGRIEITGILTTGSTDCLGVDRYIRLDAAADWLARYANRTDETDCQGLSEEGGCFDGRAIWCESGKLSVDICRGEDTCTFDSERSRYACLLAAESPCFGETQLGMCRENQARRCETGELVIQNCVECSISRGRAECAFEPDG